MSTIVRKTLVCFVAVFALGAVTASAALAVDEPTFVYTEGAGKDASKFEGASGAGTLQTAGGTEVTCTSDTNSGEMNGVSPTKLVKKVLVEFKGCKSAGHKCTSVDPAGTNENIVTNRLKGELGLLTNPTTEEEKVGLKLEPEVAGTVFADFDCGTTIDIEVRGCVIGEMLPVDTKIGEMQVIKEGEIKYKKFGVAGEQEFSHFFGGADDECKLEASFNEGVTWEEAAIETTGKIHPKAGEKLATIEVADDPT